MIVSSFFPGRIRLRANVFKDSEIVEKAIKILKSSDAIKKVENNFVTGSVLLEYYPEKIPMEKLKPLQPFFEKLQNVANHYDGKNRSQILEMLDRLEKIVATW